jgi:hypothetical protein
MTKINGKFLHSAALSTARIQPVDIPEIRAIYEKRDFDWVEPRLDFGTIVVRENGKMLGAGHLHPIVESIMLLDPDVSRLKRIMATDLMMRQAIIDSKGLGLSEIHAWVKEPEFLNYLQKRYGHELPRGTSLVLRI